MYLTLNYFYYTQLDFRQNSFAFGVFPFFGVIIATHAGHGKFKLKIHDHFLTDIF